MGKLSDSLRVFYARKGKKVVFKNGLTLNQLAISMWDKMDGRGVDCSVLSRVINGERLFTGGQLRVFSEMLSLSHREYDHLVQALKSDWMDRLDLPHTSTPILNYQADQFDYDFSNFSDFS